MDRFDEAYASVTNYFGADPDPFLVAHRKLIPPSLPILDVGCGQGRNSLPLARQGFSVDALDPSQTAIRQITEAARGEQLPIQPIHGTFQDLDLRGKKYGAVLVLGLIPELGLEDVRQLTQSLPFLLAPGGLLFITAFGTWDPAYPVHAETWTRVNPNSFRSPDGHMRTYLDPGELVAFFSDLSVLHTWEGLGPEHRHGDGPSERHGRAEAVFRQ